MRPFIGKLLSSTVLLCCLFFSFIQFVILENLSILDRNWFNKRECFSCCYVIVAQNSDKKLTLIFQFRYRLSKIICASLRLPSVSVVSFAVSDVFAGDMKNLMLSAAGPGPLVPRRFNNHMTLLAKQGVSFNGVLRGKV